MLKCFREQFECGNSRKVSTVMHPYFFRLLQISFSAIETANKNDTVLLNCSESVITCQICMDIFDSPRIFPCQHTFCKACTVSLMKKHCLDEDGNTKKSSFPCPNCRKDCKIRKAGKQSVEEHLKCFPENLLLKTLLDSIDEQNKDGGRDEASQTETAHNLQDRGVYDDDIDHHEHRKFHQSLFYCSFMNRLHGFLVFVIVNYSSSLLRVNRSDFVTFVLRIFEVFELAMDEELCGNSCSKYFHTENPKRSFDRTERKEIGVLLFIHLIKQNEVRNDLIEFRDAETQTDNHHGDFNILEVFFVALLTKNLFPVVGLLYGLFGCETTLVMNLLTLNLFGHIWLWTFCRKVFDILCVTYVVGGSFSSCAFFNFAAYSVFLLSFKQIKRYIDGGFAMDTTLPVFKLFLINLNFFANVNRWYAYYTVLLKLDFWILVKLALIEAVPDLVFVVILWVLAIVIVISFKLGRRNSEQ